MSSSIAELFICYPHLLRLFFCLPLPSCSLSLLLHFLCFHALFLSLFRLLSSLIKLFPSVLYFSFSAAVFPAPRVFTPSMPTLFSQQLPFFTCGLAAAQAADHPCNFPFTRWASLGKEPKGIQPKVTPSWSRRLSSTRQVPRRGSAAEFYAARGEGQGGAAGEHDPEVGWEVQREGAKPRGV